MTAHQTADDILRAAVRAAEIGADAVYTPRSLRMVEMLAKEGLAVQGHLGLVPRLSTHGAVACGSSARRQKKRSSWPKTSAGWRTPAPTRPRSSAWRAEALAAINPLTKLVTHSIGAGSAGDVIFMFLVDICGESERPPGHAKAFADLRIRCVPTWRSNGAAPCATTGARS